MGTWERNIKEIRKQIIFSRSLSKSVYEIICNIRRCYVFLPNEKITDSIYYFTLLSIIKMRFLIMQIQTKYSHLIFQTRFTIYFYSILRISLFRKINKFKTFYICIFYHNSNIFYPFAKVRFFLKKS